MVMEKYNKINFKNNKNSYGTLVSYGTPVENRWPILFGNYFK